MADKKFSGFTAGSPLVDDDVIVGLTNGAAPADANTQWLASQVATYIASKQKIATVSGDPADNAQYATVNAGLADGAYNLVMIGDTTDTSTVTIPSSSSVYINILSGATWTLSDCNIVTTTSFLVVNANYTGSIVFDNTSGSLPIFDAQSSYQIYLVGMNIFNESTQANSPLCSSSTPIVSDYLSYVLPNLAGCGVASDTYCLIDLLSVYPAASGTNIDYAVNLTALDTSVGIIWWFGASQTTNPVIYLENAKVDTIQTDSITNNSILEIVNCQISKIDNLSTQTLKLEVSQNVSLDANSTISSGNGEIVPTFNAPCTISNFTSTAGNWTIDDVVKASGVKIAGTLTFASGSEGSQFTNFTSSASSGTNTISADLVTLTAARFNTDLSVEGNNNIVMGVIVTNGSTATISIPATYENNIVTNNVTDVIVADSGTNTQLSSNTLIV